MKIQGPGQTQNTSKVKKKDKAEKSDESFGDYVASQSGESSEKAASKSIAKVDSLLAVQAAEDPTSRAAKQRARLRSNKILEALDQIRMAMLNNSLTVGHMIDIADVVASHREKIGDPALTAIMDEIDLRAQVELAKMRVSLEQAEKKEGRA